MRTRRAFTMFELLLLLGLLMILAGLLFPAVQKVREAAARMQSSNNLKQLGIAAHNHASSINDQFPAGVDDKNFSVLVHLLPYIEQENVYKVINPTNRKSVDDAKLDTIRGTVIKTFLSPRDEVLSVKDKVGATNYLAMAGSKPALKDNDGTFYLNSTANLKSTFTDGTSNTVIFVETLKGDGGTKAVTVDRQHVALKKADLKGIKDTVGVKDFEDGKNIAGTRGASWMDGRFLQATINSGRGINDKKPDVDCGGAGGLASVRGDRGIVIVGMGDGSVRAVTSSVSHKTWKAASTTSGGEVLGNDW